MGIERPSLFLLNTPLGSPLSSRSHRSFLARASRSLSRYALKSSTCEQVYSSSFSPILMKDPPYKEPCSRLALRWQVTCYERKSHSTNSDVNETAVFTTIFVIEAFWILSCMIEIYLTSGR